MDLDKRLSSEMDDFEVLYVALGAPYATMAAHSILTLK
jgi:hypothetical protein